MNETKKLDLGQEGNKLIGGFEKLSTSKLAMINGGESTNNICTNRTCDHTTNTTCSNSRGNCSQSTNSKCSEY